MRKKVLLFVLVALATFSCLGIQNTYAIDYNVGLNQINVVPFLDEYTLESSSTGYAVYRKDSGLTEHYYTIAFSDDIPVNTNYDLLIVAGNYYDDLEATDWHTSFNSQVFDYRGGGDVNESLDWSAILTYINYDTYYDDPYVLSFFSAGIDVKTLVETYAYVIYDTPQNIIANTISFATQVYGVSTYNEGYNDGLADGLDIDLYPYSVGYDAGFDFAVAEIYDHGIHYTDSSYATSTSFDYITGFDIAADSIYDYGITAADSSYDGSLSYDYGIGLTDGASAQEVELMNLGYVMQGFFRVFNILSIEILPNITIGMIVGVPLMLGLLSFIIGVATFAVNSSTRSNMKGRKK